MRKTLPHPPRLSFSTHLVAVSILFLLIMPALYAAPRIVRGVVPANADAFPADVVQDVQDELLQLAGVPAADLQDMTPAKVWEVNHKLLAVLPNTDMSVYYLNHEHSSGLNFPIFSNANGSKRVFYIVQEYAIYRPLREPENPASQRTGAGQNTPPAPNPTAQGVSIRMIISIRSSSFDVSGLTLGALAVAAERKKLRADISLQTVGITGERVTSATPMPAEFNFTTLSQMYQSVDRIKEVIWSKGEDDSLIFIRPQIIRREQVRPASDD